ncbi:hypothetical protein JZ751_015919 [Albula glossodonta]|uniref:Ras-related protein Rab-36 n=1 Tax=Albula glossodonta TaxID=121402 RepID=A0A8T2NTL9_9TELE|nr:hypothetical protein JZ751_015919 [Albula glossodonta]
MQEMENGKIQFSAPVSKDRVISKFPKVSYPRIIVMKMSKVVVVGDLYVGKTCLINRFCKDLFDRDYKATIGVDFEIERFELSGVPYTLQIWDTAGQEKFKCIASTYYRGAQAIIIVFDLPSALLSTVIIIVFDLADIRTLEHTRSFRQKYTKRIAAPCCCRGESSAECQRTERDAIKMAAEMHAEFWSVSSKTGENVREFFFRVAALAFEETMLQALERGGPSHIGARDLISKGRGQREGKRGRDRGRTKGGRVALRGTGRATDTGDINNRWKMREVEEWKRLRETARERELTVARRRNRKTGTRTENGVRVRDSEEEEEERGALEFIFSTQLSQKAASRLSLLAQKSVKSRSRRSASRSSPRTLARQALPTRSSVPNRLCVAEVVELRRRRCWPLEYFRLEYGSWRNTVPEKKKEEERHTVPVPVLTLKQVVAALSQQTLYVEGNEELSSQRVPVQIRGQSEGHLQNRNQEEPTGRRLPVPTFVDYSCNLGVDGNPSHHLEKHSSGHSHPVELDLEGGVEGEVAVVIAAAPFRAVAAVVDIHVQRDRFLVGHAGG